MLTNFNKHKIKENLKHLKVGDIIIAKRYNNIFEKYKIKKGHRIGPFIIIYKKGKKIYGFSCTSKNTNSNLKLNKKYNFDKETYVNIKDCKRIKNKQIIKVIDNLTKKDLKMILNEYKLLNKKSIQ